MYSADDEFFMRQALDLARQGLFTTTPNPRVGCVLVKDDVIVGQGWHERAGAPHAEVIALRDAGSHKAMGATAYITLEPCSHFGRTPPCADSLIEAGIRRVIVATQDPNPDVSGRGLQKLRDQGIDVRCGLLADEAHDLNPGFMKRMTTGMPWVRAKSAASLDGRTALPDGTSQWITDQAARDDGHAWRARACAVLTGIGTVRKDNPQLNVRAVATPRQPLRVVVDTRFEIDEEALILAGGHALLAVCVDISLPAYAEKAAALRDRGVEIIRTPTDPSSGKVDLAFLIKALGDRGCNEVHVEGGARLAGAMMRDDLIDEWLVYLAPLMLGEGMPMADDLGPWKAIAEAPRWRFKQPTMVGDALRVQLVKS